MLTVYALGRDGILTLRARATMLTGAISGERIVVVTIGGTALLAREDCV